MDRTGECPPLFEGLDEGLVTRLLVRARMRAFAVPEVVRAPPSLSDMFIERCDRCSSGATPTSTPVRSARPSVNASTVKSSVTSPARGRLSPGDG